MVEALHQPHDKLFTTAFLRAKLPEALSSRIDWSGAGRGIRCGALNSKKGQAVRPPYRGQPDWRL
ncbi:MAG TPA: hypothetical protein PLA50_18850 [Bacteroidia bacterium]|nr:hypothetical protein [Bacteroidia bacterium]